MRKIQMTSEEYHDKIVYWSTKNLKKILDGLKLKYKNLDYELEYPLQIGPNDRIIAYVDIALPNEGIFIEVKSFEKIGKTIRQIKSYEIYIKEKMEEKEIKMVLIIPSTLDKRIYEREGMMVYVLNDEEKDEISTL